VKSNKTKLLIITNLYPLPWEPNRATFNRQQFDQLEDEYELSYLIPVAFIEWIKNRKNISQSNNKRYFPYFFTPKIGRRFYAIYMFFSMLVHSGLWLKNKKPEKILASWAFPDAVAACWLSRLFYCDFYFKVHGSDIDIQCQNKARAKQVVAMSRHAKGILTVSQALADKMVQLGIERKKIQVIYNGINHEKFSQETLRPFSPDYILFIGNLKFDKGVMELLKGFAISLETYPNLHLVYAGNGEMLGQLKENAISLGIENNVKFLGNINHDKVPQWLQHCKTLALPSYHEGVPNVLLEAMSCGVPIIATDVGGIPEVINEDICGKLVTIKNIPEITHALKFVLEKNWCHEKIKAHSQKFSWQKNKQQLSALLELK
jgi:glycosyltransferase involved in cell wall biosynthesis